MEISRPNQYPLHLRQAAPLVLPRKEPTSRHPYLERTYIDVMAFANSDPMVQYPCVMEVRLTTDFWPVLKKHWDCIGLNVEDIHLNCLVLCLSSPLNGTAAALAGQWPDLFNARTLDLMDCMTFLGWSAHLPGECDWTTLQVPVAGQLNDALNWIVSAKPAAEGWKWMPMVVIDSDTVAIGGFAVDMYLQGDLQAADMSRHRAIQIYEKKELVAAAKAAKVHGMRPWLHKRWWDGEQWILEAVLLEYSPAKS